MLVWLLLFGGLRGELRMLQHHMAALAPPRKEESGTQTWEQCVQAAALSAAGRRCAHPGQQPPPAIPPARTGSSGGRMGSSGGRQQVISTCKAGGQELRAAQQARVRST